MSVLLLTEKDVADLLTMKDVVDACEKTFANWGEGKVVCPSKVTLELGEDAEWPPFRNGLNAMPAYIDWQKSAGIKCVGGSLNNPGWGLPYIIALISLFDPETGIFRAIMDGERITNYRTGAQAAVAAKYLANGKRITLGIIGTGAQGRTQLMAFREAFDLVEVVAYDINPEASKKYAGEMAATARCPITVVDTVEEVFKKAGVIVSVTHGRDKFIKKAWVRPGQTIFPMGSFTECEDELLKGADKVVVDHIEQTFHRGALKSVVEQKKFTLENLHATIGEVVCGRKAGRENPEEVIVCIPIGTGAMDVTCATVVYERAKEQGRGVPFSFNAL